MPKMPYEKKNRPGAAGENMPAALKGEIPGKISENFKGMPRNAKPNYNPHTPNPSSVRDWTQNKMQECKEIKKQQRESKN